MRTVDIHEAKTHLSRLIERVAQGEPFIIAKAGRPLVKVTAIDAPERGSMRRLGFLAGQAEVPEDFDRMGAEEAAARHAVAAVGGLYAGAALAGRARNDR